MPTLKLTVGPGRYQARLRFAAASQRQIDTAKNRITVFINETRVVEELDVAARAGGKDRALDLLFVDLAPLHGMIEIRFTGQGMGAGGESAAAEAFVQAIEIEPQSGAPTSAQAE